MYDLFVSIVRFDSEVGEKIVGDEFEGTVLGMLPWSSLALCICGACQNIAI